jgi:hypothetical protein
MGKKIKTNLEFKPELKESLSEFFNIVSIWRTYIDERDWIVINAHKFIQRGVLAADVTISLPSDSFDALVMKLEKKDDDQGEGLMKEIYVYDGKETVNCPKCDCKKARLNLHPNHGINLISAVYCPECNMVFPTECIGSIFKVRE